jgi:Domain of unknown function (DUF4158)
MKQDWHPDELALLWTLSESELELLGTKTIATRLSFAILLEAFQLDGRFPDRRDDVAGSIVAHLASQTGVPREAYFEGEWSGRTQRYQRALIREHCGFRAFRAKDESSLIAWVSERVTSPDPEMEALKIGAYDHLRCSTLTARNGAVTPLLRMAVGRCEERIVTEVVAHMSEARALTNLIGNGAAALVLGKRCNELDAHQMRCHLDQGTRLEAEEPEAVLNQKDDHMPAQKKPVLEYDRELDPTCPITAR